MHRILHLATRNTRTARDYACTCSSRNVLPRSSAPSTLRSLWTSPTPAARSSNPQQTSSAHAAASPSSSSAVAKAAISSPSSSTALSLLRSQPSHYLVASIYQRRYLLTPRDQLTVPRLKDVRVGDVVSLHNIHELGSRDYTLRASEGAVLDRHLVKCTAVVTEHTKGRMEETVKFKRRKGYKKTIKSKSLYTRLRIQDFQIGSTDKTSSLV